LVLKYNYVKVKVGNGNGLRISGFKSRETYYLHAVFLNTLKIVIFEKQVLYLMIYQI